MTLQENKNLEEKTMKKIVALVLSVVMVMGLATTAFAATAYNGSLSAALADTGYSAEVKAAVPAAPAVKAFGTYQIYKTNVETKAVEVAGPFVEMVSVKNATWTYVDGTVIRYFAPAQTYTVELTPVKVEYKATPACGDVYVATAAEAGTYYIDAKGNYYADTEYGTTVANVGGKMALVEAATNVLTAKHDYKYDTATVANKTSVTAVNCSKCKASFAFVEGTEADAVAKFGAGKYDVVTAGALYVAKTAGAAAVAGDKVESAQTFDAGIAMYVGMSVMAAAGSAVVLKKKD